jgi:zinc finger protein 830
MSDVRSLLKQTRQSRRITHPYAKYTAQGALYCTACTQKIASDALWENHITSTQHKEKVKDVIRESQRKAKRGIAATAMEDEQPEEQESRKRVRIQDPEPSVSEDVEIQVEQQTTMIDVEEGLPEDFFDEGSKPAKTGVDEDEWKKFQAEIADTIRNQEEGDQEDEEEIRRGIVEEFEELNSLEDRVERLKQRRAELQKVQKDVQAVSSMKSNVAMDEDDDDADDVEEEWW